MPTSIVKSLRPYTFSRAARSSARDRRDIDRGLAERRAATRSRASQLVLDDAAHALDLAFTACATAAGSPDEALARSTASGVFRLCARLPSVSR